MSFVRVPAVLALVVAVTMGPAVVRGGVGSGLFLPFFSSPVGLFFLPLPAELRSFFSSISSFSILSSRLGVDVGGEDEG